MPTITGIRTERSEGAKHEHIIAVAADNKMHPMADVIAAINAGEEWSTEGPDGSTALVRTVNNCPQGTCSYGPYLSTAPGHTAKSKLQNLPVV